MLYGILWNEVCRSERDTAVHTYTCPCNENTTRFSQFCLCMSICVCMYVLYVCFKQYDMSAGSYLEKKCIKGITRLDPPVVLKRRLKTFKKPINQHDNSITKLNCNLWPECTQGNVHYVLRLLR